MDIYIYRLRESTYICMYATRTTENKDIETVSYRLPSTRRGTGSHSAYTSPVSLHYICIYLCVHVASG